MSDLRTKRNRKQVDYSKFAFDGNDDDDDFADSTPPPSKKARKSQPLNPNKAKTESKKAETKSKTDRKHAAERKFEEEIQLAMQLSMGASSSEVVNPEDKINCTPDSQSGPGGESLMVTADIESNISGVKQIEQTPLDTTIGLSSLSTIRPVDVEQDGDIIEVLGQDEVIEDQAGSRRRRRSAASKAAKQWDADSSADEETFVSRKKKSKKVEDDDSNFDASDAVSLDSPSESESDWGASDDDSDFCMGKSKKNSRKKNEKIPAKSLKKSTDKTVKTSNINKVAGTKAVEIPGISINPKTSTPLPKSTKTSKPNANKKTVSKENLRLTKPVCASGSLPVESLPSVGHKKPLGCGMPRKSTTPVITRPAVTGSACVTSPSGGLRLGLSKKARIKPLHPSVNITH